MHRVCEKSVEIYKQRRKRQRHQVRDIILQLLKNNLIL